MEKFCYENVLIDIRGHDFQTMGTENNGKCDSLYSRLRGEAEFPNRTVLELLVDSTSYLVCDTNEDGVDGRPSGVHAIVLDRSKGVITLHECGVGRGDEPTIPSHFQSFASGIAGHEFENEGDRRSGIKRNGSTTRCGKAGWRLRCGLARILRPSLTISDATEGDSKQNDDRPRCRYNAVGAASQ